MGSPGRPDPRPAHPPAAPALAGRGPPRRRRAGRRAGVPRRDGRRRRPRPRPGPAAARLDARRRLDGAALRRDEMSRRARLGLARRAPPGHAPRLPRPAPHAALHRRSRSPRSASASARPRRCSRSSTPCWCGRCRSRTPTASCGIGESRERRAEQRQRRSGWPTGPASARWRPSAATTATSRSCAPRPAISAACRRSAPSAAFFEVLGSHAAGWAPADRGGGARRRHAPSCSCPSGRGGRGSPAGPTRSARPCAIDRTTAAIIGVLPEAVEALTEAELWMPAPRGPAGGVAGRSGFLGQIARLAPGRSLDAAQAEFARGGPPAGRRASRHGSRAAAAARAAADAARARRADAAVAAPGDRGPGAAGRQPERRLADAGARSRAGSAMPRCGSRSAPAAPGWCSCTSRERPARPAAARASAWAWRGSASMCCGRAPPGDAGPGVSGRRRSG